jgi:Tol biopolymer transport system component
VLAGCTYEKKSASKNGGTIIYSSSIGAAGSLDLYATAANGSNHRRLTNTPDQCESNPVLTSNQRSFYFYRYRCPPRKKSDGNDLELWRMDIDGSNETRMPLGVFESASPSPDGVHVVVVDRKGALWLRRLGAVSPGNEGERIELPRLASIGSISARVAWSHDGSRFVFPAGLPNSSPLFVLNLRTLGLRQLTSPPGPDSDLAPVFSSDDRYLAYARRNNSFYSVRLLDTKTGRTTAIPLGDEKELPRIGGVPWFFSSDGSTLVYRVLTLVSFNATSAIGVYSLSRHEQRVIDIQPSLFLPQTSPDHTRALFVSPTSAGSSSFSGRISLIATDLCEQRMTRLGRLRATEERGSDLSLSFIGPLAAWAQPGAPSSSRPAGHCELAKLLG